MELLTFFDFPKATWKSIRTTNTLENLNREFRRRTKTQAAEQAHRTHTRLSDESIAHRRS
ncbi:MAG: transposase [Acidobacteriota bacterium]